MKNTMLINLLVNKTKENPTMGCREGGEKTAQLFLFFGFCSYIRQLALLLLMAFLGFCFELA